MSLRDELERFAETDTDCVIRDDVFDWHIKPREFVDRYWRETLPDNIRVGSGIIYRPDRLATRTT